MRTFRKKIFTSCFVLLFLWSMIMPCFTVRTTAFADTSKSIALYLIAGQSNAAGYSAKGTLDETFENVGYAKEGKEGIYNILIMEEKQTIVALGAGSITKVVLPDGRIERCDNVKDVGLYIEKIDEMIERKKLLFSLK